MKIAVRAVLSAMPNIEPLVNEIIAMAVQNELSVREIEAALGVVRTLERRTYGTVL